MVDILTCVLVLLALAAMLVFILAAVFNRFFPRRVRLWLCKRLGWHDGDGNINAFDGCNVHSTCSVCGKKVMLDSQGNWFD